MTDKNKSNDNGKSTTDSKSNRPSDADNIAVAPANSEPPVLQKRADKSAASSKHSSKDNSKDSSADSSKDSSADNSKSSPEKNSNKSSDKSRANANKKNSDSLADSSKDTSEADAKLHLPEPLDLDDITIAKKSRKRKSTGSKRSRSLLPLVITVLVLAALVVGGYYGWKSWQAWQAQMVAGKSDEIALREQLDSQARQLQQLQQQLNEQQQQQVTSVEQLEARLSQSGHDERQQLDQLQRRVTSQGSRLRDLSTTTRDDWLLAEAEYLLRLANQRLLTERTTENPVSLLETADSILEDFDDPDLFAVRSEIANDITALKISATTDREGLYLKLNALVGVIPQLEILAKPVGDDNSAVDSNDTASSTVTESKDSFTDKVANNFASFGEGLKSYIRIRHRDKPIEPLLGVEEEVYLRHNLRVMLEQAQLALLREESKVYKVSLQNCQQWLRKYFELNRTSQVLIEQLDELSKETVTHQLPEISGSLQALRSYINVWHLRHEGPDTETGPEPEQYIQESIQQGGEQ